VKSRLGTGKPLTFFHSVRWKRQGLYSCCTNFPTTWNVQCICCCTIPADLLLNLKLSSGQQSYFSVIRRACGALMFLLEPKGRGECSVGLFYCLNTLRLQLYQLHQDHISRLFTGDRTGINLMIQ
jgi:hypothetical protein